MLIDFGMISQIELQENKTANSRQNQDIFEVKMANTIKHLHNTRPNHARSKIRCGHDVT
jgi:hypothetical protein